MECWSMKCLTSIRVEAKSCCNAKVQRYSFEKLNCIQCVSRQIRKTSNIFNHELFQSPLHCRFSPDRDCVCPRRKLAVLARSAFGRHQPRNPNPTKLELRQQRGLENGVAR